MTYDEARDEMLAVFKAAWDGLSLPSTYTDVPAAKPEDEIVWARVTVRHGQGRQRSLAGENGSRRWENQGTLFVSVFAPIGDGSTAGYNAAQVVADAYRSTRGLCVWFRNQRIRELGNDGAFEHIQFATEFEYDHFK